MGDEKKENFGTQEQAENTTSQSASEGKTFTQEELNKIISERLAREKKAREELENKLKQYKEQVEKNLPEAERYKREAEEYKKQFEAAQKALHDAQVTQMKYEMLEKEGLPKAWARRIQGETEEDIRNDIAELKKLLGVQSGVGNAVFPQSGKPASINDLINSALRRAKK